MAGIILVRVPRFKIKGELSVDKSTIESMSEAGVNFLVNVRVPGGGRDLILRANEVEPYIVDPAAATASRFGATKAEYLEWVESEGSVRCSATTASGHLCRNFISAGGQMEMREWKKAYGGYCAVHGSEGAPLKK